MAVAELFRALGDPTRLEMVRRLSTDAPLTITSVTNKLQITRQGARKHLQILADANVITLEPKGRGTEVNLKIDSLETGKTFIAELEHKWDERLEALRRLVDDVPSDKSKVRKL